MVEKNEIYVCKNGHKELQPLQKWSIQGTPCKICGEDMTAEDYYETKRLEGIYH
jgi:hypothetical protein